LWITAVLLLLVALLVIAVRQCRPTGPDLNQNLIVNGDAEAGPGSSDGTKPAPAPGWQTTGLFNVVQYGATNGYPTAAAPGPANRGKNFFTGGPDGALASAAQRIDISKHAAAIDAAALTCHFSGYLGGYAEQNDHVAATAEFLAAAGTKLGTVQLGPVSAADRQQQISLLFRSAAATVPRGTRMIVVTLTMTRTDGQANDGYADNLVLTLERKKE